MRPTFAEIRLGSLLHNYRALERNVQERAGETACLLAVIKADAYGHGVECCGRALVHDAGASWLGVTSLEEAERLRAALFEGIDRPREAMLGTRPVSALPEEWKRVVEVRTLIMSGFFPGEEDEVVRLGFRPQVWESWHFERLDWAARLRGCAAGTVPVHLEVDTGMSRQGVAAEAAATLVTRSLQSGSPVFVEGVLTHFSSPERLDSAVMERQIERFGQALAELAAAGVRPDWIHAGNSANALAGAGLEQLAQLARRCGAKLLVRPGLALYGLETRFTPSAQTATTLEPVMTWRTEIVSLREVPAGTPVGYNETFVADRRARLALLPVGYADGLRRELSNRGFVLVRGQRTPIVGRVSMDQTVINVSGVPGAAVGDEVMLMGVQGEERITAWQMADWCETIPYETLCGVSARVRRVVV